MTDKILIREIKILVIVLVMIPFLLTYCSRANPMSPDKDPVPIDTTECVPDTTFIPIIFQVVDMTIEAGFIQDRSGPNVYMIRVNGVAVKRIEFPGNNGESVVVIYQYTFVDYDLLDDTFSIELVEGSRAKVISSRVIKIVYKK